MDKRKLIGTIIGVLMFAALIVGATYAWLVLNATVINSTANGTTLTYWVDYSGNDTNSDGELDHITDMPILVEGTPSTAAEVTLTARRPEDSIADNITIYLKTNADESDDVLTTSGLIKYVICEQTDEATSCDKTFEGHTINTLQLENEEDKLLLSQTLGTEAEPYKTHTFKIYFWLDAPNVVEEHIGKTYSGYIHAESEQNTENYG